MLFRLLAFLSILTVLSLQFNRVFANHSSCSWIPGGTGDPKALQFQHYCTGVRDPKSNRFYCNNCQGAHPIVPPEDCYGDMVADYGYLAPKTLEFRK